jgi:hypothetical protein
MSISDSENVKKAEYYLSRAQRAAELQKSGDLSYVLYGRAILEYIKGNMPLVESCLSQLISIDPRARDWPSADRPEAWFQLLMTKYPKLSEDFEGLLKGD